MTEAESPATVVVEPGSDHELTVPVQDWLVIGRECQGIEESRRLLVDADTVSRHHCEIRLDHVDDRAVLIDLSTNGTRVNGVRVERAVPVPLVAGDEIQVGSTRLEFRSEHFRSAGRTDVRRTTRYVDTTTMALVVGDIVGYSTVSEHTESSVILDSLESLYTGLRQLLVEHRGTLNAYAGDAIFAVWDAEPAAAGVEPAVAFARAARRHVLEAAPELTLRSDDGSPLRMGWAVVLGPVAVSTLTKAQAAVIGDTTNLAFRLSGVAAREGYPDIVITEAARNALGDACEYEGPFTVHVKGRRAAVPIFGIKD